MSNPGTFFGSLEHFEKGGVQVIEGDAKHYVFSNIFEVAGNSRPYEKVAVGRNLKYVLEAIRAEGNSPWYSASHDETAVAMDGEVEVHFVKPDKPLVPESKEGQDSACRRACGAENGLGEDSQRAHGAAAERLGVPVPRGGARGAADADDPGRLHRGEMGEEICQTK